MAEALSFQVLFLSAPFWLLPQLLRQRLVFHPPHSIVSSFLLRMLVLLITHKSLTTAVNTEHALLTGKQVQVRLFEL